MAALQTRDMRGGMSEGLDADGGVDQEKKAGKFRRKRSATTE